MTGKKNTDIRVWPVLKVSHILEMKTIKYYHHLCLKQDVLLLADEFKKFRNSSLKTYGLSPSNYLSAPALNCLV